LDRPRLIAEGSGPTKAFETELANALWMADVMDGPTLRVGDRVVHTFLFALLDDCSRLVAHGQYYDNEKLGPLLDCLKEAFRRRGLPEKLYTDQGKIFTCAHLQVVCANLKIKLLHARPYAAWSKGKIERFFQTVQRDFQERPRMEPVGDLEALNARFWHWLESQYHRRAHSALGGQYPVDRFTQRATALRQLPSDTDWRRLFLARATRPGTARCHHLAGRHALGSARAPARAPGPTALRTLSVVCPGGLVPGEVRRSGSSLRQKPQRQNLWLRRL